MYKRGQVKRFALEKLMELISKEQNGQNLKMFNQVLTDRNKAMLEKRDSLLSQIEDLRFRGKTVIFDMNEGVKDRLAVKHKCIMDKNSRPQNEDVQEITNLFAFMERQINIINRNYKDIDDYRICLDKKQKQLLEKRILKSNYDHLDQQFQRLQRECEKEQKIRDELSKQRDDKLNHYKNIAASIEQARVQYETVEQNIRNAERQMVQLGCYLERRTAEDQQQLNIVRGQTTQLEQELLRAQQILNYNTNRCSDLKINSNQLTDSLT